MSELIIYADVMFTVNLLADWLLLLAVCAAVRVRPPFIRLLLGAVFGALCSFLILLPPLGFFINALIKIAVCAGMCLIAFPLKSVRSFFKYTAWLAGVTFIFCGVVTLIAAAWFPRTVSVNNLSVYADLSPLWLIVSTAVAYLAVKLISLCGGKPPAEKKFYEIELTCGGNTVKCTALHDTGCHLHDLFSGNPVIILEKSLAEKLVPRVVTVGAAAGSAPFAEESGARIRLIPYSAIGGKGMMQAFTPDRAVIAQNGRKTVLSRVSVAVSNEPLCGEYRAIFGDETAELIV